MSHSLAPPWRRLAVLAALVLFVGPIAADDGKSRPNILIVTLDTTRMDRLGLYGYERDTSPELDRLALDSMVYTRAYSVTSWTLPSHASLFTGRYPPSHGAQYSKDGAVALGNVVRGPTFLADYRANGLAAGPPTLAEILRAEGYATGGVVAGPWLKRTFGLDRGFDHWDDAQISTMTGRLAKQVTDAALPWIDEHKDGPFFLFLNYFDAHGPYSDPEGRARLFLPEGMAVYPAPQDPSDEFYNATYDGEIRYMDGHFGRLIARLRELGIYDRSWIIVTADHGELIGEHARYGHGFTLHEEELRIPLIVKYPSGAGAGGRSDASVQLTDIMAWVLDGLSLPVPEGVAAAPAPGAPRPVYAEVFPINRPGWQVWLSGGYKLVGATGQQRRLFDVSTDPTESHDLAAAEPERLRELERDLEAFRQALPAPPPPGDTREVDTETQRALESLGYLE